jgi:HlyD family secretion protein
MAFKTSRVFVVLVATLVLFAGYLLTNRGTAVDIALVTMGPMVQSVVMSGRITTVARNEITSQSTSRIESILVREGDKVRAGQVLVRLRDDEASATLDQAKAAVAEARARLLEIRTIQGPVSDQQLEQARAADLQAQTELLRTRDLVAQGFIAQSRLDEVTRAANSSAAGLRAAAAQSLGNQIDGAFSRSAQARLDQALASRQAAAARLDQLNLRSVADGVVISRLADAGDTAQPGKSILTIVSGSETRVQASVDEKNLKYLSLGQHATVIADAYADRKFSAKLAYIAPAVDAQRGTVDIRLTVDSPEQFLRTDMTVSVEIVTGKQASALMLPSDAVRRDATEQWFVLVQRDGRAKAVPVTIGLQGTGVTEIAQGLAQGDRAILPGSLVADGDKVREQNVRSSKSNAASVPGATR